MSLRGRCVVCGGPEGQCQQDYLEMLITSRSTRDTEDAAMGNTITAAEYIYRDIVAPCGTPQRELAYAPGREIPEEDARALGVDASGRQSHEPARPEDKARRGPKGKARKGVDASTDD